MLTAVAEGGRVMHGPLRR